MAQKLRILFLCRGNAARSQMAEAIARYIGDRYFDVFSAGPDPRAEVHPGAIATLRRYRVPVDGLTPKDLSRFDGQHFDFVVCLCDRDREDVTRIPGVDVIQWTFPDPLEGSDDSARARVFDAIFHGLENRIRLLIAVTTPRPTPAWLTASAST